MHDAVSEYMSSVRRMQEASIRVHEVFAMLLREESEVPVQVLNAVKASRANKDWCSQHSEYAMLETVIRPAGERLKFSAVARGEGDTYLRRSPDIPGTGTSEPTSQGGPGAAREGAPPRWI